MSSSAPIGSVCPRCGGLFDTSLGQYDLTGTLICKRCQAHQSVAASHVESLNANPLTRKNLWGRAATSAVLGIIALPSSLAGAFFVFLCPIAFIMGVNTSLHLIREPEAKKAVGSGWLPALLLALFGAVCGLLSTIVGVLLLIL